VSKVFSNIQILKFENNVVNVTATFAYDDERDCDIDIDILCMYSRRGQERMHDECEDGAYR
jgi:hypothetical protein